MEGVGARAPCGRPIGPVVVGMETLPLSYASRSFSHRSFSHRSNRTAARVSPSRPLFHADYLTHACSVGFPTFTTDYPFFGSTHDFGRWFRCPGALVTRFANFRELPRKRTLPIVI